MPTTNIASEHKRAFEALKTGRHENLALFSCFVDGEPASAIAAITIHVAKTPGDAPKYSIHPLFVSVTPAMRLTDHDGKEA